MRKAFLLVFLGGCAATQVPTGKGTDYPCGTHGVVCPAEMCCDEQEQCGGEHLSCPATMCCYVGPEGASKRRPHKQRPISSSAH
jgi:hypothetical protein